MLDYDIDVLVSGAGPVGLMAALHLARWGVSVHLVDAAAGRSVMPATLEEQRGAGAERTSPVAWPFIAASGTAVRTLAGQAALR